MCFYLDFSWGGARIANGDTKTKVIAEAKDVMKALWCSEIAILNSRWERIGKVTLVNGQPHYELVLNSLRTS